MVTDEPTDRASEHEAEPADGGVAEALRVAVERTMRSTAGSAASSRERATELVDEVVRRGRDARDELARRGQEAGAGLARRGQEATGEMGRRLEVLEGRLAELERQLKGGASGAGETPSTNLDRGGSEPESEPKAEG